jgi:hypothetical protein
MVRYALPIAASFALAYGLRFGIVEPETLAHACGAPAAPWWCALRAAVIAAFASGALALGCVVAAVAATYARSRRWALAAACLGIAGLVLFSHESGVVALLAGVLVLARHEHTRRQQAG